MVCSNCGAETLPGDEFCDTCGSPIGEPCVSCGFVNRAQARFCRKCGKALAAVGSSVAVRAPSAASPPPVLTRSETTIVAELRLVSVLFADLVGFTARSEGLDPEEVRELLSRYFDVCRGVIERYGGTVEKFIGDAVMAVWGVPAANEDDAERAVRAAMDLVSAVAAPGAQVGAPDLRARAGVLTGEAAVTLGATGQGMVLGNW